MRSIDVKVDVTTAAGLGEPVAIAATVHMPDRLDGPAPVLFCFPGGGFGRKYYDVQSLPGYSEAEFHTAEGFVVVACDQLHVGDSSHPDTFALTYENLAAANHSATVSLVDQLRSGAIGDGIEAVEVSTVVGVGQSMGGCLLTVQQGNHRSYDGVAMLGWSGIFTNFPAPDGSRIAYPMPPRGTDLRPIADEIFGKVSPDVDHFRFCFHWPDEEPALMEADLATYRPYTDVVRGDAATPWGSATLPACAITMMTAGSVAAEAAAIDVPVLVGSGERDVVPDPWAEPTAYRGSSDVRIVVVPRMSHMHNFARTRHQLWEAVSSFARSVRSST